MVINGIFRFIFLGYRRIKEWIVGSYDIGEMGEKQNYDGKSVFKLPESERSWLYIILYCIITWIYEIDHD